MEHDVDAFMKGGGKCGWQSGRVYVKSWGLKYMNAIFKENI